MKNLFSRLKPEYLERLEIEREVFLATLDSLFIELKKVTNWIDLSYSSICILKVHLDLPDYSPNSIDEIFND